MGSSMQQWPGQAWQSMQERPDLWLKGLGSVANIAGAPVIGSMAQTAGSIGELPVIDRQWNEWMGAKRRQEELKEGGAVRSEAASTYGEPGSAGQPPSLSEAEKGILARGQPTREREAVYGDIRAGGERLARMRQEANKWQPLPAPMAPAPPPARGTGGRVLKEKAGGQPMTMEAMAQMLTQQRPGLRFGPNPEEYFRSQG